MKISSIFFVISEVVEKIIYNLYVVISFPFQFGSKIYEKYFSFNSRMLRDFGKLINKINKLEKEYAKLSNDELKHKTIEFQERIASGCSLDDLLVEAFAAVKEASVRVLGFKHFDEQLLGGIALHKGMMTEMKTGEGKTLVATLPSYLNALSGHGVHIVTVNDYLAKRDSDEMGRIHRFLGLTVGCVLESLNDEQRKSVYSCDIVYGTNNQFGFDYLRDNMKYSKDGICIPELNYAIIDEADSILIDEARTPLIISGGSAGHVANYEKVDDLVKQLDETDYEKDEKMRSIVLLDCGMSKLETLLIGKGMLTLGHTLYDIENIELVHQINQSLKANFLFKRNVDYIVKDGEVMIIDEFTGRILKGRRYSDGLHQALEAKEYVKIEEESMTHASITFQKFFALYNKISGMSGTCVAEGDEFKEIYKVDAIAIPTHKKMIREDLDDAVYRTFDEKFDAIIKEVTEVNGKGQPILLITGSVEVSDIFSSRFKMLGLKHQVLNARLHKEEADIIAEAGRAFMITIATNMAGRGTDIQLGGSLKIRLQQLVAQGVPEELIEAQKVAIQQDIETNKKQVIAAGGLYVIGTERNESRRVDDQARGRSGRQGDVGKSKFFLSLDDDLIRIFGSSSNLGVWLQRFGLEYGEAISHPFITRAIAKAQTQVEARNFDMRKNVFKYDEVLDQQRRMIYSHRNKFLYGENMVDQMRSFVEFEITHIVDIYSENENVDREMIQNVVYGVFSYDVELSGLSKDQILEKLNKEILEIFDNKVERYEFILKSFILESLDQLWQQHLHLLDCLRQNVNLRAYAQKEPLNEYKKEGFKLFENLLSNFRVTCIKNLFAYEDLDSAQDDIDRILDSLGINF